MTKARFENKPGDTMWQRFERMTERQRNICAKLAEGSSQRAAAEEAKCSQAYVWQLLNWPQHKDFREILDWLTLKLGIATPAARVRYAWRVVKQFEDEQGRIKTKRDPLDWLKLIQRETEKFGTGRVERYDEEQFDLREVSDDDMDALEKQLEEILAKRPL